ncbi:hypothetical protein [Ekhidna sp.]|jgi:hypothetical protein|uniref:hypothetical protein n=1 Tax=Ekhidna sp. TaxID=2608089 RepID=UPI0032EC93F3
MIVGERQNIIDLIRKGAYSSCIITSYSFDFIFFEERFMPALKSAGIKNINLFLDGQYFDEQLENTIGKEFSSQRTYSINTIYKPGIFHPKMMFLTGPKHGLLIIGSGNVSTSGMSSNDEIWGAFHIDSLESKNAPLLAQAWNYLQQFFGYAHGTNAEKLQWINEGSPWINDLPGLIKPGFASVTDELEVQFLSNESGASIYNQLLGIIPKDTLKALNIVSPYFDKNGEAILNFKEDFELDFITCLTDPNSELLPFDLDDQTKSQFEFYNWGQCIVEFNAKYNRLHAKLFNFLHDDGTEYLLIGSCNATMNALGSNSGDAVNDEAAILIRRNSNESYLTQLGVEASDQDKFEVTKSAVKGIGQGQTVKNSNHSTRILHAEKDGDELLIKLSQDAPEKITVVIRDKHLIEIEKHTIEKTSSQLKLSLHKPDEAIHVVLFEGNNRISNYRPIQDAFLLGKTNPDPEKARINDLIDSIASNADFSSLASIFQYIDYIRLEDDFDSYSASSAAPGIRAEKREKEYATLTEEEFNQLPAVQSYTRALLNHPNVQLADLIGLLGKGIINQSDEVSEDIESSLTGDNPEEQYGGSEQIDNVSIHQIDGKKVKSAILKHSEKLYEYHEGVLQECIDKAEFQKADLNRISLNELSNMIVLMGLFNQFHLETFDEEVAEFAIRYNEKYRSQIRRLERSYHLRKSKKSDSNDISISYYYVQSKWLDELIEDLNKVGDSLFIDQEEYVVRTFRNRYFTEVNIHKEEFDSIKNHLVDTLGIFLLHVAATKGFKEYEFEVLNNKMNKFRKTLFGVSVFLILNTSWSDNEIKHKDLLLLDLLHLIYPGAHDESSIMESVNELAKSSGNNSGQFTANLAHFKVSILMPYVQWKKSYNKDRLALKKDKKDLLFHSIVYRSEIGFAYLGKVRDDTIDIKKPGLWQYSNENEFFAINYPFESILSFG